MKKNRFLKSGAAGAVLAMLLAVILAVPAFAAVRLPAPEDVYWGGSNEDDDVENGTYAYWDEIEDAYEYEVYLYRDEKKIREFTTKKTRLNLSKYMTEEGDYTFRVRALSKKSSRSVLDGYWSYYSDISYMDADRALRLKDGVVADSQNSGPGVTGGAWVPDETGWWYRRADGTFPSGGWFQDPSDGSWYFLGEDGYMMTGWIDWDGKRYYCDAEGTPSGAMVTGDYVVDGVSYTFDASGALVP